MKTAIESLAPVIAQRRHQLLVSLPPGPIPIDGDGTRREQVFANLVGNAARYTKPGGTIAVDVTCTEQGAVVRVRDNGTGIPREMLSQIFEPFTRISPSNDRSDRGLGIGLTLARGLVELHGGKLIAESEGVGQAASSSFAFPATAAAAHPRPRLCSSPIACRAMVPSRACSRGRADACSWLKTRPTWPR